MLATSLNRLVLREGCAEIAATPAGLIDGRPEREEFTITREPELEPYRHVRRGYCVVLPPPKPQARAVQRACALIKHSSVGEERSAVLVLVATQICLVVSCQQCRCHRAVGIAPAVWVL